MVLFRYRGSRVWTMDFMFSGQRIRESTGTRSKTLAKKIEDKRRRDLEEGAGGIRKRETPKLLSVAAEAWLAMKKSSLAAKTVVIEKTNLAHLNPELGRKLVCDIDARDVARYQQNRIAQGASPKTVNLEVGTLRAILRRHGVWAHIQQDVRMLPTRVTWAARSPERRNGRYLMLARSLAPVPCCLSSLWRLRLERVMALFVL